MVVPDPPARVTSPEMHAAVSIALIGYLFRDVEAEFLDVEPGDPGMTEVLLEMRSRHPEWETWFAAVTGSAAICALGEDLTGDGQSNGTCRASEHKRDSNSRCTPSRIWRSPTGRR